jgi:hypothetical protein
MQNLPFKGARHLKDPNCICTFLSGHSLDIIFVDFVDDLILRHQSFLYIFINYWLGLIEITKDSEMAEIWTIQS